MQLNAKIKPIFRANNGKSSICRSYKCFTKFFTKIFRIWQSPPPLDGKVEWILTSALRGRGCKNLIFASYSLCFVNFLPMSSPPHLQEVNFWIKPLATAYSSGCQDSPLDRYITCVRPVNALLVRRMINLVTTFCENLISFNYEIDKCRYSSYVLLCRKIVSEFDIALVC